MICFHCQDTGKCRCIACNGACSSCKGRELMEELRPWLELRKIDPRDSKWWVITSNGDGARRTKKFIPLEIFLAEKVGTISDLSACFHDNGFSRQLSASSSPPF